MNLVYKVNDKPKFGQLIVFAFQQLLAILAATIAVPSIIGNGMSQVSGTGAAVFSSICDVNIRMICYGASTHNLCFLVNEDQAPKAIAELHHKLLEGNPTNIK